MGNTVAVSRRTFWWVAGGIAALLVVVSILLVVILGQMNAAAAQDEHARIVKICESQVSDPYGGGLDAMTQCIDRLKG